MAKKVDEPMAITEVVARTPNLNNVHYEPSLEKDENGEYIQVPVPRGYVASGVDDERYVNGVTENGERVHSGGFVIYEGMNSVTSENLDEAQRTRNQYVWVPINSEEAAEGKMYNITNGLLYANYYKFNASGAGTPRVRTEEQYLTMYDLDERLLKQYMEGITRSEFLQEMREEFYEMIVSVKTYGGFYIGRYETGNTSKNELKVVKMQSGTTSTSNPSANNINFINWYKAYTKSRALRGTAPVSTSLIWGIQWDETLKWLVESGEKTAANINSSGGWGNYINATFTYTNTNGGRTTKNGKMWSLIPTGSAEYTKANNIYDLAGNVYEWTIEVDSMSRCRRGGSFFTEGYSWPAHSSRLDLAPNIGHNEVRG